MVPINLDYDPSFLEEEVREDYLVTSKMKKLWLVELDILNKFVQVCDKYDITYFADAGTLLGAVRHGGYVPWDDDIDIILLRKDFDRFLDVAKTEFQYPYYVYNIHNNYADSLITRIMRLDTTIMSMNDGVEAIHGKKRITKNIKCIQIDIFCADNCPDTPDERNEFNKNIKSSHSELRKAYFRFNQVYKNNHISEEQCNVFKNTLNEYKENFENVCKSYENENTSFIYNNGFDLNSLDTFILRHKEDYSDYVLMPFEMLTLKCPIGYERALDMMYTNREGVSWKIPVKNCALHTQGIPRFIDFDNSWIKYNVYYYNRPEDLKKVVPPNDNT